MNDPERIFAIPYTDQPGAFWSRLFANYSRYIKEVYFPVAGNRIGTGRPVQPSVHLTEFLENDYIPKAVLINPVILPRPVEEIAGEVIGYLRMYLSRYNITGVSLANLTLAGIVREEFPALEITASTLMEISTVQQVLMLGNMVNILVPSGKIIRDLKRLKEIRQAFPGRIRLIVNESCLPGCPHRTQHFFEMADFSNNCPRSLCDQILAQFPWMRLTGSWVLPHHLHFFEGLYDELKIAGRVTLRNPADYLEVLESYFFRKKQTLNKIGGGPAFIPEKIKISDEFYEYTLNCDKNCAKCTVCNEYWNSNT